LKILLLAYAVSPYRGSEYNVAWNHITQMAKKHEITVLYGSSGVHMGDDDDMQKFHQTQTLDNVKWHRVAPSTLAGALNSLNKKGYLTYSFYLAYRIWHQNVYNYCKKQLNVEDFDIIHYLTPIGYREPGYLWKLGRPYIWGPIGGANSLDSRLLAVLPKSGQFKLLLRKYLNWFQLRYSHRLKKALKAANLLLTATTENKEVFQILHGTKSTYIPENGTIGEYLGESKSKENSNVINLIWIGTIEARKALKLLIDSFAYVDNSQAFKVHILGDGPLKETLTAYAQEKGLGSVFVWYGHIPRTKVLEVIQNADFHIITSVSEANTTVIWEAMQNGVPTMALDHCGMCDTITSTSGIKVKVSDYDKVVKDFAMELNKITENPCSLSALIPGVKRDFYKYHWDNRIPFFDDAYKKAIENWQEVNR
jgi:glycosyltransferase involved in cell wall biosynthesis